ncbi:MAG: hypothetical protein JWR26_1576 [Pedosphaera sp.]|nr:hypothetical protein [Pedosphaera sp.]
MKEHIHNWLTEKMRVTGMLACGVRSPDRKTFTRSQSPQFTPVALENACRCLSDTFQILNSNRFPVELVRWVYENYFVYGFVRPDGHCLAVLARRSESTLQPADLETIVAEFHSLPG